MPFGLEREIVMMQLLEHKNTVRGDAAPWLRFTAGLRRKIGHMHLGHALALSSLRGGQPIQKCLSIEIIQCIN